MGKPTGKKHQHQNQQNPPSATSRAAGPTSKPTPKPKPAAFDEDTAMFITMSQELREEGNRLFQKQDHEGAMLKYEKALNLLPRNHIDVANLRTSMARCYTRLGLGEYPRAIHQCNLALQVSPKYTRAVLKRAKCYQALNRLDLALRDVRAVLGLEPNNLAALEFMEGLRKVMEEKGLVLEEEEEVDFDSGGGAKETPATCLKKVPREKSQKKKKGKRVDDEDKAVADKDKVVVVEESADGDAVQDKEVVSRMVEVEEEKVVKEEKLVEEEKVVKEERLVEEEKGVARTVKLVFGEDIRWAQLPANCSVRLVRDIVRDRFPGLKGVLVKYRDEEGDLVTITTTDELRLAESAVHENGSIRFYISEVDLDQEPCYDRVTNEGDTQEDGSKRNLGDGVQNGGVGQDTVLENNNNKMTVMEEWILQFARLFKNHVGFDSDSYLDFHELAMSLYAEAMEDTVTGDEAQELFEIAADKFQEMSALAMFNWGNVHMSKARNRAFFAEDGSREPSFEHVKAAYEWALNEYKKAEMRYEEALKIKPDFFEGYLALGHQQFEQARLCWCYALACKVDLEAGPSEEVLQLYNKAEDSMEKGILMWEEIEEQRLNGLSKSDKYRAQLEKMGMDRLLKDISSDEASKKATKMKSQIYLYWGTLLYERSVVEYKLGLPTWEECLEVAVEKFELAGASATDVAVIIKNHCSHETALEGFKIDEIVQAWNEMYDAQGWLFRAPSFRLEALFRRRIPKLHYILEQL
ncbi:HSP-interacting protein [Arachis ipaensis]|uniref:HSP-interacting protein n=1 Tax=Arachis ipaensis TaxID=130454 RepID=UPI000A2B534B|nr:HSP-interacting protein [Arachis ipaensis]